MSTLNRHRLLMAAAAGGVVAAARPMLAQSKPHKLVYVGDNRGGWKRTLTEEVGPFFEKETGIKVEFTLLPPDAWQARNECPLTASRMGPVRD
jgi:multiple sugar transport system substrate-binding protein